MTNPTNRGGDPVSLHGGDLGELRFQWSTDRYSHSWCFGSQVVLESCESDSAELWPASPPLQQIHQQSFGDGREVLFGLGMAGRGHWSASFTLIEDLRCWIVELACRSPAAPESLSSCYRTNSLWQRESSGLLTCLLDGGTQLSLEAIQPSAIAEMHDDRIAIRPTRTDANVSTSQWTFRLRVLSQ